MAECRIAIIGGGKMGEAIAAGLLASQEGAASSIEAASVAVVNPGEAKRRHLEEHYGVATFADVSQAPSADTVILAVKPQVMDDVLASMAQSPALYGGGQDGPLFVSIAAGLPTQRLEAGLASGSRVVRAMPNMPLTISQGATGLCAGSKATDRDVAYVRDLFSCLGEAVAVDEAAMDAVCAVSGSGPAYAIAFIEALRDGGVAEGLDPALAERLALQTVFGTAALARDDSRSLAEIRESICSPGGTTLAALDAMDRAGFHEAVCAGVAGAAARGRELASC